MDLKTFPKVELHRHLEGSVRLETLIELARHSGQIFPSDPAGQRAHFLVESPMKDLATVLNKFWATQAILHSKENIRRITFEVIEDAYHEGIKLLELRYAPTFIQTNHKNLSFEEIHKAVLQGLADAKKYPIGVGLICTFQRTLPLKDSEKVLDFVLDTKETWIGVDLADDEDAHEAKKFRPLFEKAKKHEMKITIHAGESHSSQAPLNVIDAIEVLHADRIGHGLQIIHNPKALEIVRDRKIPLELCPTSNWLTNAIPDLKSHPFKKLTAQGILTTINSDDPGIFGINLTNEYLLLQKEYSFSKEEFRAANENAARASFLSESIKKQFWSQALV